MEEQTVNKSRSNQCKWILGIVLTLTLILGAAWFVVFRVNAFTLSIQLTGEETVVLEYGKSYEEPGASVSLYGTLFWKEGIQPEDVQLQVTGEVDETKIGNYTILIMPNSIICIRKPDELSTSSIHNPRLSR